MSSIKFECPHCHGIMDGDESFHGRRVQCANCQETILVPGAPAGTEVKTARLVEDPAGAASPVINAPHEETEIFDLSPAARAFPGRILLGIAFLALAAVFVIRAEQFPWPQWAALIPLALGLIVLLLLLIKVKSTRYRLTSQRLFVRRGLMARHVNELELYRVKDVVVVQKGMQRLLGYGAITVLSDDDSTPEVTLSNISSPEKVKEMLRTQYRAARQREGVHPTEFMQSS